MRNKSNLKELILEDIKKNPKITEEKIAEKYNYSDRTVRRYIRELREKNIIKSYGNGRKHYWKIM